MAAVLLSAKLCYIIWRMTQTWDGGRDSGSSAPAGPATVPNSSSRRHFDIVVHLPMFRIHEADLQLLPDIHPGNLGQTALLHLLVHHLTRLGQTVISTPRVCIGQ
jgi:hypothetical protein